MNGLSKLLLDTDTLSLYLRKAPQVVAEAQAYLRQHSVFTVSIITRFEILRGMKVKSASGQLDFFNLFCQQNDVIALNDQTIITAADIYADLYQRGQLIGDADILIAATALENNLALVTNNQRHFARIKSLQIINWNQ